ncbi:DnaJ C-terminal domain-containing protein [Streptomyces sp. CLCI03]
MSQTERRPRLGTDSVFQLDLDLAQLAFGDEVEVAVDLSTVCSACAGAPSAVAGCPICDDEGLVTARRTLTVPVPAGIEDGTWVRVPGGDADGAFGGTSGELYALVVAVPHPVFTRTGNDLRCVLTVPAGELVPGVSASFVGLDGTVAIRMPADVGNGATLRIPGRGVPDRDGNGRGDLYVTLSAETGTAPQAAAEGAPQPPAEQQARRIWGRRPVAPAIPVLLQHYVGMPSYKVVSATHQWALFPTTVDRPPAGTVTRTLTCPQCGAQVRCVVRSIERTRQLRRWWSVGVLTTAAIVAAAGVVAAFVPDYESAVPYEVFVGVPVSMGLACLVFGRLWVREFGFRGPQPWTNRSHLVLLADDVDRELGRGIGRSAEPVVVTTRHTLWEALPGMVNRWSRRNATNTPFLNGPGLVIE